MMAYLRQATAWYDGRMQRERVILAVAVLSVTALAFEGLWWGPQRHRAEVTEKSVASLEVQQESLQTELTALEAKEAEDPDTAIREQLDLLTKKIGDLDERLRGQTLQVLAPEQMPAMLRDMIGTVEGLRITGMHSEPAQQLVNDPDSNLPVLYRHGLVIDLKGDYFGLLQCMRKLEGLPWRLYWSGLDIRAHGFEPADFRLHVYAVSLREEWIRV
jgi:MSHA biogenesis protein MshJ